MNDQLYPSFNAFYGREPIAGQDYDPDGSMCQDDYEFFTGAGRYSDDVSCTRIDSESSTLEDVIGECWGRGFTDIVQRGSHTTINGKTWMVTNCTGQQFLDVCEKWDKSLEKDARPSWWQRRHELNIGGLQIACNFSTRQWSALFYANILGCPMGMGMGSGDKPF